MLHPIKNLLKDNLLFIAISITIGIAVLSLVKLPLEQVTFNHIDKLEHLFAYACLSLSWILAFNTFNKKANTLIITCCILFGIVLEVLQNQLTSYRTGEFLDIIANTLGVLLGFLISQKFATFFRKVLL